MKKSLVQGSICFYAMILVLLSSSAIMYSINLNDLKDFYEFSIDLQKSQEFESIWIMINETQRKAKMHADDAAQKIQEEIFEKCDLDELKTALSNNDYNEEFETIIRSNIEGNYFSDVHNWRNDMFMIGRNKIIADYNRNVAEEGPYESVDEFVNTFANVPLSKSAYKRLLMQDNTGLIIAEKEKSNDPNHKMYTYLDKEHLKELYFNEGLKGFETYSFLVPSYITPYGDIFGHPDIIQGKKTNNHKLIVVQMFNICDQIETNYKAFNTDGSDHLYYHYNRVLINLYLLGIFISIAVIGLLIITCYRVNQLIEEYDNKIEPLDSDMPD